MAPKRARVASSSATNPDFDEGFDESKFVSSEAQIEYNRLRSKPIARERGMDPAVDDGDLVEMIRERR